MYKYDNLTFSFREYKDNRITVCEVNQLYSPILDVVKAIVIIFTGIARLKPGDTPNQHEAQLVSLGRALANAGFSKEYRKKVINWWAGEYQKRHKDTNGITLASLVTQFKLKADAWAGIRNFNPTGLPKIESGETKSGDILVYDDGDAYWINSGYWVGKPVIDVLSSRIVAIYRPLRK